MATRRAHLAMPLGAPEQCCCIDCRNFAAARHLAYPPEALALFSELGIRHDRESEVGAAISLPSGRLLYSGWFHFVGRVTGGPQPRRLVGHIPAGNGLTGGIVHTLEHRRLTDTFALGLIEKGDLLPLSFGDQSVVQLEFTTEVPWVLSESPDSSPRELG